MIGIVGSIGMIYIESRDDRDSRELRSIRIAGVLYRVVAGYEGERGMGCSRALRSIGIGGTVL